MPQDEYPTSRVTVTASNTTPSKIDELTHHRPGHQQRRAAGRCTTNPFDKFNLAGFTTITPPGRHRRHRRHDHPHPAPGQTTDYTRDQALALTEAHLTE